MRSAGAERYHPAANGTPARATNRFPLIPFEQIAPSSGPQYLVQGLIPREGLALVWGPPKCGKTFWVLDLVLHIALGQQYRGRRVTSGAVVYVCLEGERGFRDRIEAFRQARSLESAGKVSFYLIPARLDLAKDHSELAQAIREELGGRCVAIVVDTLNRSLNGSESSDEDMSAYVKGCDALRETLNCAVIVVHHCGHEASRPRGHTSLLGAVDAQIAVKRDSSDLIVATVDCMKDGPADAEILSRLRSVEIATDRDGECVTSCVIEPADDERSAGGEKPSAPLSDQHKVALEMLRQAIGEAGEAPPVPDLPARISGVKVDLWRSYCDKGTVSASENPDTKRVAFKRAADRLQAAGIIAISGGWVWIVSR